MKKCVCGHEMTRHDWKHQWVCHRCGRTKPTEASFTNADRIRAMSDEELAEWLKGQDFLPCRTVCDVLCVVHSDDMCKANVLRWLQQPAEVE